MRAANDNGDKVAYSYREAVAATGASRNTLSKMVSDGKLQVRRWGSRVFIPRSELERVFGSIDRAA